MRHVILNADDLGYDPNVSFGIVEAMEQGIVSSTTFMVNTPHSEHAARLCQGKDLSVGLHLNLAKWLPLSKCSKEFLSADGQWDEAKANQLPQEVVDAEVKAQVKRFQLLLDKTPTHIDVHKHLHRHEQTLNGVISAAKYLDLPVRSIDSAMRQKLKENGIATNDHFLGDAGQSAYWTIEELDRVISALPTDGVIELMCHPGYTPTAVRSAYSRQREVELMTFKSESAREILQKYKIVLEGWNAFKTIEETRHV